MMWLVGPQALQVPADRAGMRVTVASLAQVGRLVTPAMVVQAVMAVRVGPGAMCIRGQKRKAIRMPAEKRRPVVSLKPARQVTRVPMDAVVARDERAEAAIVPRLGKVDRMAPTGAMVSKEPPVSRGRPAVWIIGANKGWAISVRYFSSNCKTVPAFLRTVLASILASVVP